MPFDFLQLLCNTTLPLRFESASSIDQVCILESAGLVEAIVPPTTEYEDGDKYAGPATVLRVTARGRDACHDRNLLPDLLHFGASPGKADRHEPFPPPEIVLLEWNFSPPDYFDRCIHVAARTHVLKIDIGKITARIDGPLYRKNETLREALQKEVLTWLRVVQMLTHKPFELSAPHMRSIHPVGATEWM